MEYKGTKSIEAKNREEWRRWLSEHHKTEGSVWLVIYHKDSGISSVYYNEAVDEGLCFGWIDSLPNKRDDHSYYQYFSKRNPKSNWSKVNKYKVERLIDQKLMTQSGFEMVELAKKTRTWDALNDVDNLVIPSDMVKEFELNLTSLNNWNNFPDSTKRGLLEWIFNAKRNETRKKRMDETIKLAAENKRANQYKK